MAIAAELIKFNDSLSIIKFSFGMEEANTYAIVSENHAVLIDICSKQVIPELVNRGLVIDYTILTHEHCDHIWGLNELRKVYSDMKVIAQTNCSNAITDAKLNKSLEYRIYAVLRFGNEYDNSEATNRHYQCLPANIVFDEKYSFKWHNLDFQLFSTPGHSPGSCMIALDDYGIFSGDTMIYDKDTFLLFDGGDQQEYRLVTEPFIRSIPSDTCIYPGHGKVFNKKNWRT